VSTASQRPPLASAPEMPPEALALRQHPVFAPALDQIVVRTLLHDPAVFEIEDASIRHQA